MEQSPTCRWGVKNCKIKDGKEIVTLKTYVTRMAQWAKIFKKSTKQGPLLMGSGSRLVWIGLMECLDNVGCVHKVFGRFPTHGIGSVVEPFPLDQVKQS